jgi:hemerythrin
MALHWTPSLAVGVAQIDEQHKTLFSEVEKLAAAMSKKDPELVSRTLEFLGKYVAEHFTAEEALMAECQYPGTKKHVDQHRTFVKEFSELKTAYERDGATVPVVLKMSNWLLGWLWNHIRGSDIEMARFAQVNAPSLRAVARAAV